MKVTPQALNHTITEAWDAIKMHYGKNCEWHVQFQTTSKKCYYVSTAKAILAILVPTPLHIYL